MGPQVLSTIERLSKNLLSWSPRYVTALITTCNCARIYLINLSLESLIRENLLDLKFVVSLYSWSSDRLGDFPHTHTNRSSCLV